MFSRLPAVVLVALFLVSIASPMLTYAPMVTVGQQPTPSETSGRAQTTWSGTQTLSGSYTIGVADELIIQACTIVRLPANERIVVDGRLTVLGTQSCPVVMEASGLGDHEGIQFNTSSSGRGSLIQNLTIDDAIYGVTVYGSNPVIENLTVNNPDRVAVDLFSSAVPESPICWLTVPAVIWAFKATGDTAWACPSVRAPRPSSSERSFPTCSHAPSTSGAAPAGSSTG